MEHDIGFAFPQVAGLNPLDLRALVSHWSGLEAANFAAFNECNTANEKIAAMQKQIRSLQVCPVPSLPQGIFNVWTTVGCE